MKTITKKIAKNGAEIWYVDGKRVSRETAQFHERDNRRYQEWLERVAAERINNAIEDYAVSTEAQDAAVDAEIELAANTVAEDEISGYDETAFDLLPIITDEEEELRDYLYDFDEKQEVLADKYEIKNPPPAPEATGTDDKIAALERSIANVIAERNEAYEELAKAEADDEIAQEVIDYIHDEIARLTDEYWELVRELESLQKTPPENPAPETPNETPDKPEENTFIAQNGASLTIEGGMPTITANGNKLEVNGICLGEYYTNEDAQIAAETLKYDVEEFGDDHPVLSKDYFAEIEFEESPTGGERTAEHLNANAPAGWSVTRADKKIRVDYQGKRVAEVDRITDRDLLVPHAFFQQFQPLVDKSKTPEQIFLDDRYRELAELEEMREEIQHTPPVSKERLKTLDDMIEQVKRDIVEEEFSLADTVESYCKAGAIDEDGNVWF